MNKLFYAIPLALALTSCNDNKNTSTSGDVQLETFRDSVSYALGSSTGAQIKEAIGENPEELFNIDLYNAGMRNAFTDTVTFPEQETMALMQRFQSTLQERQQAAATEKAAANKKAGEDFLAENAKKENVMTTASGLQYIVLEEGSGDSPSATDQVTVNYEGRLIDGTVFDKSQPNQPATFGVNQVIPGWTEGLQLMKEGAKYQFFIPSDLGYGERGSGARIEPGSTLIFDVELLEVKSQE